MVAIALAADPAELRRGMEAEEGWKLVETKSVPEVGPVAVRHKAVLGEDCLEGSITAPLDADALLTAAVDVEGQPKWSSWSLPAAQKLTPGTRSFDYYQLLDNPAPVADRFWFVHATSGIEGDTRFYKWDQIDASTRYPEVLAELQGRFPGAVSTRTNLGDWTFRPGEGGTFIRYRICTDAGGNIPRWVGEIAARSTLPANVGDFVKEVRRRTGAK
jgi:hypothetical protein